jgi:hypothetical protein
VKASGPTSGPLAFTARGAVQEARVRIDFERSGGFGGMVMRATVDSDALPPDDAGRLHELVQQSKFFTLPTRIGGAASGADRFEYRVTIDGPGGRHEVTVGDSAVTSSLRPLLDWLTDAARKTRGRPSTS